VHCVVADLSEAEHAFNFGYETGQLLRKLRMVLGDLDEVQQLLAHQIFQRVAKSKLLLYAQRSFALFNPSLMKFYSWCCHSHSPSEKQDAPLTNIKQGASSREVLLYSETTIAKDFVFVARSRALKSKPQREARNCIIV
jgi:hypothetical protein